MRTNHPLKLKEKTRDLNDDGGGGGGICSISDDVEMATTSTPTTYTTTTYTTTPTPAPTTNTTQTGFFAKLFKRSSSTQEESEKHQITKSLHSFQDFPDHLIRVYTGNFDSVLGGYKTFIVDENAHL
jgi:SET domain-containing protein